jgi:oxalate decarboxylase/phosphoglucose isomerase-like protein (cupin superfamily)
MKLPNGNLPFQKDLNADQTRNGIYVDQRAGETIFVPTGWHHQVWNMVKSLAIVNNPE